jgi:radical SAM protein with 4Fe4S-binding SPASM domain
MRTVSVKEKILNARKYKENFSSGASVVSHTPVELFVESANVCNLRCLMCRITYSREPVESPFVSLEWMEKLEKFNPGLLEAHLHGFGEPLLNRELMDIIRTIRRSGGPVVFDFFTNAVLLDRRMSETIVDAEVDRVILSIDGGTRETYETIHKGARWETLLRNLADLDQARKAKGSPYPKLEINLIAMNGNFHEFPAIAQLAADYGIGKITVKNLAFLSSFPEEVMRQQRVYDPEADDAIIAETKRIAERHGVEVYFGHYYASRVPSAGAEPSSGGNPEEKAKARPAGDSASAPSGGSPCASSPEEKDRDVCFQPWKTFYVKSNGEVKPCCFSQMVMGDLRRETPEEIWNGPRYRKLREALRRGIAPEGCSYCRKFDLRPRLDDTVDWLHVINEKSHRADRRSVPPAGEDGSADASYRKAQEIIGEGRLGEAANLLGDLIATRGDKPLWHNDLGCLRYALGDMPGARSCLEKAVRLDPSFADALKNLAGFYSDVEGRLEEAIGLYRRALEREPDDGPTIAAIERLRERMECSRPEAG